EPTRQTGHKSSGIGLNSRGLHDLFVAHARHRIGFLVHIDANVDNPATIGEALVCHGEFLIKALRVSVLERIFSFFPSLSAIPRELIQHSDFLCPWLRADPAWATGPCPPSVHPPGRPRPAWLRRPVPRRVRGRHNHTAGRPATAYA